MWTMLVKDAMSIIRTLKDLIERHKGLVDGNPYHSFYADHVSAIKLMTGEVQRIEELVYNMELDDSHDSYELIVKYKETLDG